MTPQVSRLPNGIRIVTAEMPGTYSVTASVLIGVGSRHEDFQINGGVSHFLEHLLFFAGTKKRPHSHMIAEEVEGVGGMNNAYTTNDLTNFYIKLPKKHFSLALDILADIITAPLFDPNEIERERKVVIEEMNILRDDPAHYVHDLIPQVLWPQDPLGREIIGSSEVIHTIDRQTIIDYQSKHYRPNNMVISVAGNVKHQRVVDGVEELFGNIAPGPDSRNASLCDKLSSDLVLPLAKATNQAHLVIGAHGYSYDHPLDMAATVLANLLGSGASSRLFTNVRGERGLAYHVYAEYSNYTDTGLFEIYAGVNLDKINLAMEAILEEVRRVREEPVDHEELVKVKNKMNGAMAMSLENSFNVADRFGTRLLLTNQIKTIEEVIDGIESVTPEAIMEAAQDLLRPDKLRMAVIAPEPQDAAATFEKLVKE